MAQLPQDYRPPPAGWVPVYYAPPRPPISAIAVTGFVFALAWLFGVASAIGLVLSIAALVRLRDGRLRGTGLAIAGVIIGFVGTLTGIPFIVGIIGAIG